MEKVFNVYKTSATITRPNDFDIEMARDLAEVLGEPFIGIFERNMKVLEGK